MTTTTKCFAAAGLALALLQLTGVPAQAQFPTKDQSKCIRLMNKKGSAISRFQLKEGRSCLRNAQKGKTDKLGLPPQPQTAEDCLSNDVRGKLAKASSKLTDTETKSCVGLSSGPPTFGYTSATNVDAAAKERTLTIFASLFGPDLDASVVDAFADKTGALCQGRALGGASRIFNTLFKEALRAKGSVLKCSSDNPPGSCAAAGIVGATSSEELETGVFDLVDADAKGKIAKTVTKITESIERFCAGTPLPLAAMFPGDCAGALDVSEFAECVIGIGERDFCVSLNAFDGFSRSCGVPTSVVVIPDPVFLLTRELRDVVVELDSPAPSGGLSVDLVSNNPGLVTTPATVVIDEGAVAANLELTSGFATGSTTIDLSAADLDGSSVNVSVSLRTLTATPPLVGVSRTHETAFTLADPAPVGGASFNLSVDDPGIATVSPATVVVAAGSTTGLYELVGVAEGSNLLSIDGTAEGYEAFDVTVNATDDLVDLPPSANLAMGLATDVLVLIAPDPAPVGGGSIEVVSADPASVEVLTPNVVIPEGEFAAVAQVRALVPDATTSLSAALGGFAADVMNLTSERALQVLETTAQFGAAESESVIFRLQDPTDPIPAPSGGVTASVVSDDTDCVTAPVSATISAGTVHGLINLQYGGVAALPCSAEVTVSSAAFGTDSLTVTVGAAPDLGTISVTPVISGNRVGAGLQATYRATLPTGAHGGISLQIKSDNPDIVAFGPDTVTPGSPVIEIAVADGISSATFSVQGIVSQTGAAEIRAGSARFETGTFSISVDPPLLDILSLTNAHTITSIQSINDDNFQVRTGVLNAGGTAFGSEQSASPGLGAYPVTLTSSNASVFRLVTTTSDGATALVNVPAGSSRTAVNVTSGGVAVRYDPPITGTATLTASGPGAALGFDPSDEDITVTVNPATITFAPLTGAGRVGAQLQQQHRITLSGGDHGGVTVRVTSGDVSLASVAADATTPGSEFIDVAFANGETIKNVFVQGVATGSVTVSATAPAFDAGDSVLEIVPPILDIISLATSHTVTSVQDISDDAFQVRTGIANTAGTVFGTEQSVSPANAPLAITVSSDDPSVATVANSANDQASQVVSLAANQSRTPISVGSGGVALRFDPPTSGSTNVSVSAPGFDNGFVSAADTVAVTVNPATMQINPTGGSGRLGAGLQVRHNLVLSGGSHGGVTVRVTSGDDSLLRVSTDGSVAGSTFVDLVFADGETSLAFFAQGVLSASGQTTLTATAPGFETEVHDVSVETAILDIISLSSSQTTNTVSTLNDDAFQVRTGISNAAGTLFQFEMELSPANAPLTLTLSSSNTAVGQIENTGGSGASRTTTILAESSRSPSSVATGGVALGFTPTSTGSTDVSAAAPGFNGSHPVATQSVAVTQNPAQITLTPTVAGARIGAGLQSQVNLGLGGGDHGGVTIRVTSSTPAVALVAPDDSTPGSAFIDINIADQAASASFFVQGVSGTTGTPLITATSTGFLSDDFTASIETPVLDILSLAISHSITTVQSIAEDPFQVRTGIPSVAGTTFGIEQEVSAAAGPLTITMTSDNTAVTQLKNDSSSGASVDITIGAGDTRSPISVGTGGAAATFTPTTTGLATVSASAAGFDGGFSLASEDIDVTVSPASMTLSSLGANSRIGAGLQASFRITLSGGEHGGVTVRVAGDTPATLLVAPDATTVGTSFIDVFFADGETTKDVRFQGVTGTTGTVNVTISAPGFTSDVLAAEVVEPVLDILSLTTTHNAADADDAFQVRTGIPNTALSQFQTEQGVSAAASPLTVTLTSSDAAVAAIVTSSTSGSSGSVSMLAGESRSPISVATNGVALDFLTGGSTDITATAVSFRNGFFTASETVTVSP